MLPLSPPCDTPNGLRLTDVFFSVKTLSPQKTGKFIPGLSIYITSPVLSCHPSPSQGDTGFAALKTPGPLPRARSTRREHQNKGRSSSGKKHLCSHPVGVILVASLESFDLAQRFSDSCCQNLLDSQKSVKTRPISGKITATPRGKKPSLTDTKLSFRV